MLVSSVLINDKIARSFIKKRLYFSELDSIALFYVTPSTHKRLLHQFFRSFPIRQTKVAMPENCICKIVICFCKFLLQSVLGHDLIRIMLSCLTLLYARQDSNLRPSAPQADVLSI